MKRLLAMFAMMAAMGAVLFAGSGSASASEPDFKDYPTCGAGGFCVWDGTDSGMITRFRTEGNEEWPASIVNDDNWWRNNGYYQPGADHVRVYDSYTAPDAITLCIHRGARGSSHENGATKAADDRGNYHSWGGECTAGEPQLH